MIRKVSILASALALLIAGTALASGQKEPGAPIPEDHGPEAVRDGQPLLRESHPSHPQER